MTPAPRAGMIPGDMLVAVASIVGGMIVLMVGAEALVRGASRLALRLGITPLVVGLTVVAFGTSTPEMATSVIAQTEGKADVALGNIVGSNIANVGLILALCGLIAPLPVQAVTVRRDLPALLVTTGAFVAIFLRGWLGRLEGAILLGALAVFIVYQVRGSRREPQVVEAEYAEAVEVKGRHWPTWLCALAILVGLALLAGGGKLLVDGAVVLARRIGLSERVIGLTIIAVGTSLPELAASVVAVLRKEVDVAVGNVLGSNLFNILGIGGVVAIVAPARPPEAMLALDLPVLVVSAVATSIFLWTRRSLSRAESVLLLVGYAAYVAAIVA